MSSVVMSKAKTLPIGTRRARGPQWWVKTAQGWKYDGMVQDGEKKKPDTAPPKSEGKKSDAVRRKEALLERLSPQMRDIAQRLGMIPADAEAEEYISSNLKELFSDVAPDKTADMPAYMKNLPLRQDSAIKSLSKTDPGQTLSSALDVLASKPKGWWANDAEIYGGDIANLHTDKEQIHEEIQTTLETWQRGFADRKEYQSLLEEWNLLHLNLTRPLRSRIWPLPTMDAGTIHGYLRLVIGDVEDRFFSETPSLGEGDYRFDIGASLEENMKRQFQLFDFVLRNEGALQDQFEEFRARSDIGDDSEVEKLQRQRISHGLKNLVENLGDAYKDILREFGNSSLRSLETEGLWNRSFPSDSSFAGKKLSELPMAQLTTTRFDSVSRTYKAPKALKESGSVFDSFSDLATKLTEITRRSAFQEVALLADEHGSFETPLQLHNSGLVASSKEERDRRLHRMLDPSSPTSLARSLAWDFRKNSLRVASNDVVTSNNGVMSIPNDFVDLGIQAETGANIQAVEQRSLGRPAFPSLLHRMRVRHGQPAKVGEVVPGGARTPFRVRNTLAFLQSASADISLSKKVKNYQPFGMSWKEYGELSTAGDEAEFKKRYNEHRKTQLSDKAKKALATKFGSSATDASGRRAAKACFVLRTASPTRQAAVRQQIDERWDKKNHRSFRPKLRKVFEIEDSPMESSFQAAKKSVGGRSRTLYHGTDFTSGTLISRDQFRLKKVKAGRMFGDGVYLAEHSSKSAQYLADRFTRHNARGVVFSCEAALGTIGYSRHGKAPGKVDTTASEKGSVLNPEYCVHNPAGVIPRVWIDLEIER